MAPLHKVTCVIDDLDIVQTSRRDASELLENLEEIFLILVNGACRNYFRIFVFVPRL